MTDEKKKKDIPPDYVSAKDFQQRNPSPGVFNFAGFMARPAELPVEEPIVDDHSSRSNAQYVQLAHSINTIVDGLAGETRGTLSLAGSALLSSKEKAGQFMIGNLEVKLGQDLFDISGDTVELKGVKLPAPLTAVYRSAHEASDSYFTRHHLSNTVNTVLYLARGLLIVRDQLDQDHEIPVMDVIVQERTVLEKKQEVRYTLHLVYHSHKKSICQLQRVNPSTTAQRDVVVQADAFSLDFRGQVKKINLYQR